MTLARLVRRNLTYFWRSNVAVLGGVAIAVAVLSGALLVGDSVRGSLRDLALNRLGATGSVITSSHAFREQLASDISRSLGAEDTSSICPILRAQGVVSADKSGRSARNVEIYGIDERFWRFHAVADAGGPSGRDVFIGESLARELQAGVGDTLLIRVEVANQVPTESFFGRRDDPGRALRLPCARVVAAGRLGEFSLRPGGGGGLTAFIPLPRLQRELGVPEGANVLLAGPAIKVRDLRAAVASSWKPADAGVSIRTVASEGVLSVESPGVLLGEAVERAALNAAATFKAPASPVYTYLATSIQCGGREIPYAVITAADLDSGALEGAAKVAVAQPGSNAADELRLNRWAASELQPRPGDTVEVSYFVWRTEGRLETETTRFHFAGIVETGRIAGPSLAPDFPGITEAKSLTDWDPPFPFDLRRIRPEDERYWDEYRTTPKAFIGLERGRALWGTRFGRATSVRVKPAPGADLNELARAYPGALMRRLDPGQAGLDVTNAREQSLEASRGSTDFGEYFLYFSVFLIAAALLLAALFFKLGVEQRVREVGALAAGGFTASRVRALFLLEALVVAGGGAAAGMPAALGYASVMLHGLGTWWTGATGTTPLTLHLSWPSLATGALLGIAAALLAAGLTLRTLGRSSPRALLAGTLGPGAANRSPGRTWLYIGIGSAAVALLTMAGVRTGAIPQVGGFFGAGSLLLLSAISGAALYLRRNPRRPAGRGWRAIFALGARNAGYRPSRSLYCVTLIAGATFVIVSLETFRQSPSDSGGDRQSGTGGFALAAECALPLAQDMNSPGGREAAGLQEDTGVFRNLSFVPFRLKAGDDASCLNLFAPREPRVLGVPESLIRSGRFRFEPVPSPAGEAARRNPWRLLDDRPADGAVPAIADANTIRYILHRAPGDELTIRGTGGEPVRLRLVAALQDSIFQSEVLISESNFLARFPDQQGFRFFLVDVDSSHAPEAARLLEQGLADWGFDVRTTSDRLAEFHEVENAYLSTFQSLGGLGLLLGTAGMAAVLLRNVLERRRELALLRAVGFSRTTLVAVVLAENVILVGTGLLCGAAAALVAVSPVLLTRANPFPFAGLLALACSVFVVGLGASALAAAAAFRTPLLAALRSE